MTTDDWPRGTFIGCNCGTRLRVKNAAVVVDGPTCDNCATWPTLDEDELGYVADSLVSTELGWCGCGNPEDVDRMMLAYLEARAHPDWPKPPTEGVSEDAELLLSYIADDLEWTEHGGSVGGAWLTDDGKAALENLSAALTATRAACGNTTRQEQG